MLQKRFIFKNGDPVYSVKTLEKVDAPPKPADLEKQLKAQKDKLSDAEKEVAKRRKELDDAKTIEAFAFLVKTGLLDGLVNLEERAALEAIIAAKQPLPPEKIAQGERIRDAVVTKLQELAAEIARLAAEIARLEQELARITGEKQAKETEKGLYDQISGVLGTIKGTVANISQLLLRPLSGTVLKAPAQQKFQALEPEVTALKGNYDAEIAGLQAEINALQLRIVAINQRLGVIRPEKAAAEHSEQVHEGVKQHLETRIGEIRTRIQTVQGSLDAFRIIKATIEALPALIRDINKLIEYKDLRSLTPENLQDLAGRVKDFCQNLLTVCQQLTAGFNLPDGIKNMITPHLGKDLNLDGAKKPQELISNYVTSLHLPDLFTGIRAELETKFDPTQFLGLFAQIDSFRETAVALETSLNDAFSSVLKAEGKVVATKKLHADLEALQKASQDLHFQAIMESLLIYGDPTVSSKKLTTDLETKPLTIIISQVQAGAPAAQEIARAIITKTPEGTYMIEHQGVATPLSADHAFIKIVQKEHQRIIDAITAGTFVGLEPIRVEVS